MTHGDYQDALRSALAPISLEPAETAHTTDWTGGFGGAAIGRVSPTTTDGVAAVLSVCAELRHPVVSQGGNTGLVGGAVPPTESSPKPLILQTSRLRSRLEFDLETDTITCSAGFSLAEVQELARRNGRLYGVDLAARDSATVGGTVATNAGGIRVVAYGMTRANLVGLEYVTGLGEGVDSLDPLPKDNTGYNLADVVCGSEGTLAVVTTVQLSTHSRPDPSTVFACPVPDLATASEWTSRVGARLLAAEVMDSRGWNQACVDQQHTPFPVNDGGLALLAEVEDGGTGEGIPDEATKVADLVVALDAADQRRIWALRELQSELWSRRGLVMKFDVSIPVASMDGCIHEIEAALSELQVANWGYFGHIADGNLHLEVVADEQLRGSVTEAILQVVAESGGSISAEHGIGRAKASQLRLRRTPAEIRVMKGVKAAFDPHGILNPGVLLETSSPISGATD